MTPLFTGMEKEVQEVQGVTPREEVAQLASVRSITPQLGTDASGDAPLLSSDLDPLGIPAGQHFILAHFL